MNYRLKDSEYLWMLGGVTNIWNTDYDDTREYRVVAYATTADEVEWLLRHNRHWKRYRTIGKLTFLIDPTQRREL